ncbi:SDR family NAD(P)-dependent oxidoreductase, partial [Chloroflexota bacterium]
ESQREGLSMAHSSGVVSTKGVKMRLNDRVAIVTGGGIGIGKAYSFGLASEGAKVVVADIDFEAAKTVAREIEQQGREALPVETDVSDQNSTLAMAEKTVGRFGKIDILVNNAALFTALGPPKPWDEIDVAEWDRVMAVNLRGLFLCSRAVVPHMKAQGKGKIINISSGLAYRGIAGRIHYITSKAGVLGFTRALARELAGQNINVNAIAPGFTLSEGIIARGGSASQQRSAELRAMRCVQTDLYPEDLVGTLVFLASNDSDFVCGQTIVADGGVVFV